MQCKTSRRTFVKRVAAGGINSCFLLDQLECQDAEDASVLSWDASGWIGSDINRLILQRLAEVNLYGRNDHERGVGSGLANAELERRPRYEITPQFAPYVGVTWNRNDGNTADFAREEGEDNDEVRIVAGVRLWF
ncbi:copper resistance protein B [Pseudomonas sp. BN415]|nr:copper resistance protein B [Pseudomonas sp. BN415]